MDLFAGLPRRFPDVPDPLLWKTELLFRGVRFTAELAAATAEGAAPNFWPYRQRTATGQFELVPVPYLFKLEGGAVARVRVDDQSVLSVRREAAGQPFTLCRGEDTLCAIDFVRAHTWQSLRTTDGAKPFAAGVEQLGDMLVVNLAPGCEYFRVRNEAGEYGLASPANNRS